MSALRSLRYLVNRFVLRRQFLTARAEGSRFRVKTEDVVGRHIYKYGRHEPAMTAYLRRTIEPQDGDLLIDVGANIGWYTLLFAQLARGTDARVLAFEPAPDNLDLLRQNLALNPAANVDVFGLGLADTADGAELHLFGDSNRGRHSVLPINDHAAVQIPTARLDDVIGEAGLGNATPRVIKIDIEGFELVALRGAPETLARCPLVVTEFSPAYMRQGGLEPADMLNLLAQAGLAPSILDGGEAITTSVAQLLADDRQRDVIWQRPAS